MIRLAAALGAALLAGCSTIQLPTAGQPAPPPAYAVEIDAPDELKPMLAQYLDLERFREQAAGAELSDNELGRLIAAAPAQARSLLETEGYFEPDVTATRDDADPPTVRLTVVPGARARIRDVELRVVGALEEATLAGNARATRTLRNLQRAARDIDIGEPFRQATWSDIKTTLLARLQNAGYPLASWQETRAVVDTPTRRVDLQLTADSGPLFRIGELKVEGLARYNESVVRRMLRFQRGDVATEAVLLDFQERLQKAGLFETASVTIDLDPAQAAATPVTVRVRELPLQQATVGLGISANTGPRTTVEHTHRRVFGYSATATNKLEVGRDRRAWEGALTSHPLPQDYRNLASGSYEWLESADEVRTTWDLRVGRSQDRRRLERLNFVGWVSSRVVTAVSDERAEAVSLNSHLIARRLNSLTLPTRGWAAALQLGGGYAQSNFADNGPFLRSYLRGTYYLPVRGAWHLQTRFELGQVFARTSVGIPDTILFRAGGDDSVRGYAYRTLGPERNGVVDSGRVLATGSVEVARPILASMPDLWGAAFVDAGQAADDWNSLRPVYGYGFGVRYRSPVGALRVDIAYGEAIRKFRLHFSVGVAL